MRTLIELFETSVTKFPNNPLLWEKSKNQFAPSTYLEIRQQVYHFAAGLITIGLKPGERVGLLSEGQNSWLISELGILYCGAVNVPLSVKLESPELKFRLIHSGSRMVIVSAGQASKIEEIKDEIPDVEFIIHLDPIKNKGPKDLYFKNLIDQGIEFLKSPKQAEEFKAVWTNIQPDDLANISYTSGTTADPKGIMLTHLNYASNVVQANTVLDISPKFKTLAILPWDHSFAHTACLYTFMYKGASVGSVQVGKTPMETLRNVPTNIQEFKPEIMMSVPALLKSFRKNIEKGIESKGKITSMLFNRGLKVAYKYNGEGWNKGKGWRALLKPEVLLWDKLVFSKVRQAFGGNLQFFIGGGALLDIELQRFFSAIGTPVYQGYGLTEASPVISANSPLGVKFGSSGRLVKKIELKICDYDGNEVPAGEKGELVVRGENIMKGYWQNPKASAETLKDGWLYTGDLGYISKDGYVYVMGRFKSLLIGNDGEKFSPEGIEEAIVDQSPYIDQAMLYNNQNPYTVGLIVPNISAINQFLNKHNLTPSSPEGISKAIELIKIEIDAYRKGGKYEGMFPERWLPTAIIILPESFTEQNHLLNSTLKMVRSKIAEHFSTEMEYIYTPEAKEIGNMLNKESLAKWNK